MIGNIAHIRESGRCKGIPEFPHYFVGLDSLTKLATRDDRVCVLNILGTESRTVTPVSHVYSGGNVVCGVQPGRSGSVLKTELNDIPVYNTVAEALAAGRKFNVAVVYVPPAGVKDAVIEAVRVNPSLVRVIIITEKVPLSDARIIRQYCQFQGVDVFGGNCLGDRRRPPARAHRRRPGRQPSGRVPGAGLGGHLLQLRQLHHHHRRLPAHRRLGHDRVPVVWQGRLHPLRRAGVHQRLPQGPAQPGRGDVHRAWRLLRAGPGRSKSPWSPAWSGAGRTA